MNFQTKPTESFQQFVALLALVLGGLEVMVSVARLVRLEYAPGIFGLVFGVVTIGLGIGVDQHRKRRKAADKVHS